MENTRVHWRSRDLEHLLDLYLFKGQPVNKDPDHKVIILINHGMLSASLQSACSLFGQPTALPAAIAMWTSTVPTSTMTTGD